MSHPKSNIERYSGYRLRFGEPRSYEFRKVGLKKQVEQLLPLYTLAAQEPFFMDDALRGYEPIDVVMTALTEGELFLCRWGDDPVPVGIVMISEILHERKAKIDAYALPQWRENMTGRRAMAVMIHEIIDYCFRPFVHNPAKPTEDALGLLKIKAEVCRDNMPALSACRALKFQSVGLSPFDALFNGEPRDTLLLELLNPEFFTNAVSQISAGAELHASPELHSTTSPPSTSGNERNRDNEADRQNGRNAPIVATTGRNKPAKSSRPRKVRK